MAQQVKVVRYEGQTRNASKDLLTKASTAITAGRLVGFDSSGYVVHATNSTTARIVGIAMEAKASSDTSTAPILIDFIRRGDLLRITVDAGTVAQATVGLTADIASAGGVDVGTTTHSDLLIINRVPGDAEVLAVLLNAAF